MTLFALRGSILGSIFLVAAGVLACTLLQASAASAQRVTHPATGGRMAPPRTFVPPPAAHTTISRPVSAAPPLAGAGLQTFRFHPGPDNIFRRHVFFGPRFFRFGWGWRFNYGWWRNYCPYGSWGFDCYGLPFYPYGYGFENYVILPAYEPPVYIYLPEGRDLVWLYLKDGNVYRVTDYWFMNSQVHFITFEEGGAKSSEEVIALDQLDLQRTIDVNTRRGFRVVMRDAPLDQYLRDHPDANPPLAQPPPTD